MRGVYAMLGYTLWHESHYKNLDEILNRLEKIAIKHVSVVLATSIAGINDKILVKEKTIVKPLCKHKDCIKEKDAGGFIPRKEVINIIHKCHERGFHVALKPHIHARNTDGCKPAWWSGWIGLSASNRFKQKVLNCMINNTNRVLVDYALSNKSGKGKISGLILATEIVSLLDTTINEVSMLKAWYKLLGSVINNDYQNFDFITYASNAWMPEVSDLYYSIWLARMLMGDKWVVDMLMNNTPFEINNKYITELLNNITRSYHNPVWKEQTHAGLNMYPYWTFDKEYHNIYKQFTNYTIEYALKFGWFKWNVEKTVNHVQLVNNWKGNKPLIITEAGIEYFSPVMNDEEYNRKWWDIMTCLFDNAHLIYIWDDRPYGTSVVLDAIERIFA